MNTREPFESIEEVMDYGKPIYIIYYGEWNITSGWAVFESKDRQGCLWFKNWEGFILHQSDYGYGKGWLAYPYFCEKEEESMEE